MHDQPDGEAQQRRREAPAHDEQCLAEDGPRLGKQERRERHVARGHQRDEDHRRRERNRQHVPPCPRSPLADVVDPVQRVHRRADGAGDLPDRQQRPARDPEQLVGVEGLLHRLVGDLQHRRADLPKQPRPHVALPHLAQIQKSEQPEDEQQQRHDRREHLKGDRAGEQQQLVALERGHECRDQRARPPHTRTAAWPCISLDLDRLLASVRPVDVVLNRAADQPGPSPTRRDACRHTAPHRSRTATALPRLQASMSRRTIAIATIATSMERTIQGPPLALLTTRIAGARPSGGRKSSISASLSRQGAADRIPSVYGASWCGSDRRPKAGLLLPCATPFRLRASRAAAAARVRRRCSS